MSFFSRFRSKRNSKKNVKSPAKKTNSTSKNTNGKSTAKKTNSTAKNTGIPNFKNGMTLYNYPENTTIPEDNKTTYGQQYNIQKALYYKKFKGIILTETEKTTLNHANEIVKNLIEKHPGIHNIMYKHRNNET
jgi:hypothetical protein